MCLRTLKGEDVYQIIFPLLLVCMYVCNSVQSFCLSSSSFFIPKVQRFRIVYKISVLTDVNPAVARMVKISLQKHFERLQIQHRKIYLSSLISFPLFMCFIYRYGHYISELMPAIYCYFPNRLGYSKIPGHG